MRLLRLCLLLLVVCGTWAWADNYEIPSRAKRIYAFERAGLKDELRGLDELDQDLLYFRAQRQLLENLKLQYPQISELKLSALKSVVRGEK